MVFKVKMGECSKNGSNVPVNREKQKERPNMNRVSINVQDQFLNQIRKEKIRVSIEMLSGMKLEGFINCFDNFSIILEDGGFHLIYKHGISLIKSADGEKKLKFFENGNERRPEGK